MSLPESLRTWRDSYQGHGAGAVDDQAMPEPWIGPLLGHPRLVVLAYHAGKSDLTFQGRTGLFADEINTFGSYSTWAASAPYSRAPWTSRNGRNRFQDRVRLFARRFHHDDAIEAEDILVFEHFPWHVTSMNITPSPSKATLESMVWAPLAEIDTDMVFAFGGAWVEAADAAGLFLIDRLGQGGRPLSGETEARSVLVYRMPSGQRLVVGWQKGYLGPPGAADTEVLRGLR